jgi:hypothetical protein
MLAALFRHMPLKSVATLRATCDRPLNAWIIELTLTARFSDAICFSRPLDDAFSDFMAALARWMPRSRPLGSLLNATDTFDDLATAAPIVGGQCLL